MNFKRKLLLFLISFIIIPFNSFAYSKYLIPGGENIGIKVEAKGVFVVGFYDVDGVSIAKDAGFSLGDRIISINNHMVNNVSDLIKSINSTDTYIDLKFGFIRDNKNNYLNMTLTKAFDGTYKTGIYVKDSLTGIGTITFVDPKTNIFGALGHEIVETNSGVNFTISKGNVYASTVKEITKSVNGNPGEKKAILDYSNVYGNIFLNKETGIFGKLDKKINDDKPVEIANISEVIIGKAEMITVLENNQKEKYAIEILSIDEENATKNFMFKIVDDYLLQKTGGVVKGMSGSPIIQNGKIIGAVTHAIVDDPKKGFGISIIKMLESIE